MKFDYTLKRPYPSRWFAPVAIIGGIILLVLFSLINFGASAVNVVTEYSNNPNDTLAKEQPKLWNKSKFFNWDREFEPTEVCNPRLLSVGDRFFTSNHGFVYTLRSITEEITTLPSIQYLNHPLENCITGIVDLQLHKSNLEPPPAVYSVWGKSEFVATAHCTTVNSANKHRVGLYLSVELTYNDIFGAFYTSNVQYIINTDPLDRASVWWGSQVLASYWIGTLSLLAKARPKSKDYWVEGAMTYVWANKREQESIYEDDFFWFDFWILPQSKSINGANGKDTKINVRNDTGLEKLLSMYNDDSMPYSKPAKEGLQFAKVMHSLMSVDLGNSDTPNYLLHNESLQRLLAGTDDYNRSPGEELLNTADAVTINPLPRYDGPLVNNKVFLNESYHEIAEKHLTGELGTTSATIYTEYICRTTKLKSAGTIILAILIADLVFLSAAWWVLNWVAGLIVERDPEAILCKGCAMKGRYEVVNSFDAVKPMGNTGIEGGVKQRLIVHTN